jgi:hypothetical protein
MDVHSDYTVRTMDARSAEALRFELLLTGELALEQHESSLRCELRDMLPGSTRVLVT